MAFRSRWTGPAALLSGTVALAIVAASLLFTGPAFAGVTSSIEWRDYRVDGTTRASLLAYMRRNPFPGDQGPAYANIRQTYALSLQTKEAGGVCRPSAVNVHIHFVITLPKAVNASALAGSTRGSWDGFVAFARHHEETRRSIFLQCG